MSSQECTETRADWGLGNHTAAAVIILLRGDIIQSESETKTATLTCSVWQVSGFIEVRTSVTEDIGDDRESVLQSEDVKCMCVSTHQATVVRMEMRLSHTADMHITSAPLVIVVQHPLAVS